MLYTGTTAQVITLEKLSEEFDVTAGLLQDGTLVPFIFIILVIKCSK